MIVVVVVVLVVVVVVVVVDVRVKLAFDGGKLAAKGRGAGKCRDKIFTVLVVHR